MWASIGRWTVHILSTVVILFIMTAINVGVGYEAAAHAYQTILVMMAFVALGIAIHKR